MIKFYLKSHLFFSFHLKLDAHKPKDPIIKCKCENGFSWGCAKQFCIQNKPQIEMQVSFSVGKTNISEHFNCSFILQFASWNCSWVYEGKTRRKGWRISSRTWWSLQTGFLWQEWRSVQSVDFFSCHVTFMWLCFRN